MSGPMSSYLLPIQIEPYFFTAVAIAFVLAVVSIWWSRHPLFKIAALLSLAGMVIMVLAAGDGINNRVSKMNDYLNKMEIRVRNAEDSFLSRPKPVTFKVLQDMIPEGHPGHLVLYGEVEEAGIYLLLRTPNYSEPRYYLMTADEKIQEQFQEAEIEARGKKTQLLLGGKQKMIKGKKQKDGADGHGTGKSAGAPGIFHPAPISSGGPEKP